MSEKPKKPKKPKKKQAESLKKIGDKFQKIVKDKEMAEIFVVGGKHMAELPKEDRDGIRECLAVFEEKYPEHMEVAHTWEQAAVGNIMLFYARINHIVVAAGVITFQPRYNGWRPCLTVSSVGGRGTVPLSAWAPQTMAFLEGFAASVGCGEVEVVGRTGWKRVLKESKYLQKEDDITIRKMLPYVFH